MSIELAHRRVREYLTDWLIFTVDDKTQITVPFDNCTVHIEVADDVGGMDERDAVLDTWLELYAYPGTVIDTPEASRLVAYHASEWGAVRLFPGTQPGTSFVEFSARFPADYLGEAEFRMILRRFQIEAGQLREMIESGGFGPV